MSSFLQKSVLVAALLLAAFSVFSTLADVYAFSISGAASGFLKSPYGGKVLSIPVPCTCPTDIGKFVIAIGPPSPGLYLVDMRTIIAKPYPYGMWIVPNAWHLGWRKPVLPDACLMVVPNGCIPNALTPPQYEVIEAGTSLPF